MAISILLNGKTHDLIVSEASVLHQRDSGDYIYFILPITVAEGTLESTATVTAKYLTPGNIVYTQTLTAESDIYNEKYYRYPMQINTNFTGVAGLVGLQLSVSNTDSAGTSTFSFSTSTLMIPIKRTSVAFSTAQEGGAVTNIGGIALVNSLLTLTDTNGSTVGTPVTIETLTSSVAETGNDDGGLITVITD